jgi:putative Mg2+ transporter-C (MgtC) family protein
LLCGRLHGVPGKRRKQGRCFAATGDGLRVGAGELLRREIRARSTAHSETKRDTRESTAFRETNPIQALNSKIASVRVKLARIPMLSLPEVFLRLGVAALLGIAIGIERDLHRRPAGMRTSAFVCMGSALFTILSYQLAKSFGDTSGTRIASNLVQGIGFLGAGAILREGGGLIGLTTAATIFVEAAIGMAVGGGLYAVGGYATGVVLFGLVVVGAIARATNLKPRMMGFRITASHTEAIASEVQQLLESLKIHPKQFRVSMNGPTSIVEFHGDVGHRQQEEIVQKLSRTGVVVEVVPFEGHAE